MADKKQWFLHLLIEDGFPRFSIFSELYVTMNPYAARIPLSKEEQTKAVLRDQLAAGLFDSQSITITGTTAAKEPVSIRYNVGVIRKTLEKYKVPLFDSE